jgi:hypothetical protein
MGLSREDRPCYVWRLQDGSYNSRRIALVGGSEVGISWKEKEDDGRKWISKGANGLM